MNNKVKVACIVGAFSGTLPVFLSLISVDAENIFDEFEWLIFLGYVIKTIVLMTLGAFVVFVNSEVDLKKAFQLGIMAPALIVGGINASNFSDSKKSVEQLEKELKGKNNISAHVGSENSVMFNHKLSFSLINTAYAANHEPLKGMHNAPPSSAKLMWYGVTGNITNVWGVFVGSHKNETDAKQQVKELAIKGYDARIYPPFKGSKYYGVTIGSFVTIEQARKLKQGALEDGLPKDTYLWRWK